jgi:alkane 1-monooxygenase
LETVNYVEHYGLFRNKVTELRYEDVEPMHSWNSDHALGRLVLFELTRHSDHHWEPAKHYQTLDSMPGASQLPAGYPAMMLLALVPPLWFRIMNGRLPR